MRGPTIDDPRSGVLVLMILVLAVLAPARPALAVEQAGATDPRSGPLAEPGTLLVVVDPGSPGSQAMDESLRAAASPYGLLRIDRPAGDPNDPRWPELWGLQKIAAAAAWDTTRGSSAVVAVLDTGADLQHQDLAANLLPGASFVSDEPTPQDGHGHGTHVAGTVAAIGNNGVGVAGVAYESKVIPIKVLSSTGGGTSDSIAAGIRHAADRCARVINMSLGGWLGPVPDPLMKDACAYAWGKGVVIVAAAEDRINRVFQ